MFVCVDPHSILLHLMLLSCCDWLGCTLWNSVLLSAIADMSVNSWDGDVHATALGCGVWVGGQHTLADARRLREELLQKERDGETLSKGQQKQVLRTKRVIQVLNRGTEGEASESVADKVEAQEKTTVKGEAQMETGGGKKKKLKAKKKTKKEAQGDHMSGGSVCQDEGDAQGKELKKKKKKKASKKKGEQGDLDTTEDTSEIVTDKKEKKSSKKKKKKKEAQGDLDGTSQVVAEKKKTKKKRKAPGKGTHGAQ